MEQAREEAQKQLKIPLRCPRCSSLNTRFRYFNNNSLSQPRHYCRSCKRQWTAGGKQRLIPIGGKTRNGEPTKTSSSEGGHSRSHPLQPPLSQWEQHQQNLTMMTTMVSPNCDTTLFQPITTAAVSPSNYFRDKISCLYAAQTSIQQVSNHHVGVGTNMAVPQEWNVQTMTPQQALSQQNSVTSKFYQTHTEALPLSNSYINGVAQPSWPVNSLPPQDITYGSSFTMSNACLENNLSRDTGDKTDTEDTAYVNVDEWLNLQGNDPE